MIDISYSCLPFIDLYLLIHCRLVQNIPEDKTCMLRYDITVLVRKYDLKLENLSAYRRVVSVMGPMTTSTLN